MCVLWLVKVSVCCFFGTQRLTRPMLAYLQLDRKCQTSVKFQSRYANLSKDNKLDGSYRKLHPCFILLILSFQKWKLFGDTCFSQNFIIIQQLILPSITHIYRNGSWWIVMNETDILVKGLLWYHPEDVYVYCWSRLRHHELQNDTLIFFLENSAQLWNCWCAPYVNVNVLMGCSW